jgi:hypothetical protein
MRVTDQRDKHRGHPIQVSALLTLNGFNIDENKGPLKTTLCENETTLFENSPITSALDHINENAITAPEIGDV